METKKLGSGLDNLDNENGLSALIRVEDEALESVHIDSKASPRVSKVRNLLLAATLSLASILPQAARAQDAQLGRQPEAAAASDEKKERVPQVERIILNDEASNVVDQELLPIRIKQACLGLEDIQYVDIQVHGSVDSEDEWGQSHKGSVCVTLMTGKRFEVTGAKWEHKSGDRVTKEEAINGVLRAIIVVAAEQLRREKPIEALAELPEKVLLDGMQVDSEILLQQARIIFAGIDNLQVLRTTTQTSSDRKSTARTTVATDSKVVEGARGDFGRSLYDSVQSMTPDEGVSVSVVRSWRQAAEQLRSSY